MLCRKAKIVSGYYRAILLQIYGHKMWSETMTGATFCSLRIAKPDCEGEVDCYGTIRM